MSTVRDKDGNILNETADYVTRHKYSGNDANVIDWYDTHPEDRPKTLPSAADLDAVVTESEVADATATRGDDVPQVQLSVGPVDGGLALPAESAVPESAVESDGAAGDIPEVSPSGDEL